MNKKFISVIMAAILAVSATAVCASAAEAEDETAGAEVAVEASGDTGKIRFVDPWNSSQISFHIWDEDTGLYATKDGWGDNAWGSKKIRGTKVEGEDNVWESFEFEVIPGHNTFVIVYNENEVQTFNNVMTPDCFGDTLVTTGGELENPADSKKTGYETRFEGTGLGAHRMITSIGNIVGDTPAPADNGADIVAKYVYDMASKDQSGEEFCSADKVANAINVFETNADDVWAAFQDKYSGAEDYASKVDIAKEVINPTSENDDSDSDSDSDSDTSSGSSSNTSSTSSKSSTTTTTTKTTTSGTTTTTTTGSTDTSTASTGDTRGVVAFAAVLLAAAGTIVATRKKVED